MLKKYIYPFLFFIFISCSEQGTDSLPKSDAFVYMLIGTQPDPTAPDSVNNWIYQRFFNYALNTNLNAWWEQEKRINYINPSYQTAEIGFNRQRIENLVAGREYQLGFEDDNIKLTRKIEVLPLLTVTCDSVSEEDILFCWKNLDADFYHIVYFNGQNSLEFSTQDTFLYFDRKYLNPQSEFAPFFTLAAFKGIDRFEKQKSNFEKIHGYAFSYSACSFFVEIEPGLPAKIEYISKQNSEQELAAKISNFYSEQRTVNQTGYPDYIFGQTIVSRDGSYLRFRTQSWFLNEPLDALDSINMTVNQIPVNFSPWAGFYRHGALNDQRIRRRADSISVSINIADITEQEAVTLPDTFSIQNVNLVDSTLYLQWSLANFADEYLIWISMERKLDSLIEEQVSFIDSVNFSFPLKSGFKNLTLRIIALKGRHPWRSDQPSFNKLKHYLFAVQNSSNSLKVDFPGFKMNILRNSNSQAERLFLKALKKKIKQVN